MIECASGGLYIRDIHRCNGIAECPDESDESGCDDGMLSQFLHYFGFLLYQVILNRHLLWSQHVRSEIKRRFTLRIKILPLFLNTIVLWLKLVPGYSIDLSFVGIVIVLIDKEVIAKPVLIVGFETLDFPDVADRQSAGELHPVNQRQSIGKPSTTANTCIILPFHPKPQIVLQALEERIKKGK